MSERRSRRQWIAAATAFLACAVHASPSSAEPDAAADRSFVAEPGTAPRPFATVYESWFGDRRLSPNYGRAALEVLSASGLGLFYYGVVDPHATGEQDKRPPLGSLRFDADRNSSNHLLQPMVGAQAYGAARLNGLGFPTAFAYGAVQSLLWEVALEWREHASVNDLVAGAIGGAAVGEVFFHATDYFASGRSGGPLARTLGWTLGLPRRLHMEVDDEPPPAEPLPPDGLGLTTAYGHDVRVAYEAAHLTNDAGNQGRVHRVRVDASFVAMPGFLRPGSFTTLFTQGNFTELHLRAGGSDADLHDVDLSFRATLFGQYGQRIRERGSGGRRGHAAMLGIGPGLRYQTNHWLGRDDQLSAIRLPGLQADVWWIDGWLNARLGIEANAELGSVRSLAYPVLTADDGTDGTKSVLRRHGYAYSLGEGGAVRGSVGWGLLSLLGSAAYRRYGSIEGMDRFQEGIVRDHHGVETVLELEGGAEVDFRFLTLGAGFRERQRTSRLDDVRVDRWDRDLHLSIGLAF